MRGREGGSPATMDPFVGWALGPGLVMLRIHPGRAQGTQWEGRLDWTGLAPCLLVKVWAPPPNRQGPGLIFLIGQNQREGRGARPPLTRSPRARSDTAPSRSSLAFLQSDAPGKPHTRYSRSARLCSQLGKAARGVLRRGWLKNSRTGSRARPRPLPLMRGSRGPALPSPA